jgi:hypothetical protein
MLLNANRRIPIHNFIASRVVVIARSCLTIGRGRGSNAGAYYWSTNIEKSYSYHNNFNCREGLKIPVEERITNVCRPEGKSLCELCWVHIRRLG